MIDTAVVHARLRIPPFLHRCEGVSMQAWQPALVVSLFSFFMLCIIANNQVPLGDSCTSKLPSVKLYLCLLPNCDVGFEMVLKSSIPLSDGVKAFSRLNAAKLYCSGRGVGSYSLAGVNWFSVVKRIWPKNLF